MVISVEPLSPAATSSENWLENRESLEQWNEAYRRVEAYFLALHVNNKLLLSSLVLKILGRANLRHEQETHRLPVEIAAEETDKLIVSWFRDVLGDEAPEPLDRISARGRLALLLVESRVPWQQLFLSEEPVPEQFKEAIREAYLRADPDFSFVEMRPRPIDLGIVHAANRTLESMGRFRTAVQWALWIAFGALLSLIFFLTR